MISFYKFNSLQTIRHIPFMLNDRDDLVLTDNGIIDRIRMSAGIGRMTVGETAPINLH